MQFLSFNYQQTLYLRLHSLLQRGRFVEAYTEEFHMLVARNDLSESDDQLMARYLGGLRPNIQEALSLHPLWTISKAFLRALAPEKLHSRSGSQSVMQPKPQFQPTQTPVCSKTSATVPNRPPPSSGARIPGTPSTIRCFTCRQVGHRAAECPSTIKRPNKGKGLLIEADDPELDISQPIYDDDGE